MVLKTKIFTWKFMFSLFMNIATFDFDVIICSCSKCCSKMLYVAFILFNFFQPEEIRPQWNFSFKIIQECISNWRTEFSCSLWKIDMTQLKLILPFQVWNFQGNNYPVFLLFSLIIVFLKGHKKRDWIKIISKTHSDMLGSLSLWAKFQELNKNYEW